MFTNSKFITNRATGGGGAVFAIDGINTEFTNCTFDNNRASIGEALDIRSVSAKSKNNLQLCSSGFCTNENPTRNPLTVTNGNFTSSQIPAFIHITGGMTTVNNSTFEQTSNNDPSGLTDAELKELPTGTAISADGLPQMAITDSTFSNFLSGAGVIGVREPVQAVKHDTTLYTFTSNTFENNIAYEAGAMYLLNSYGADISSNTFTNNSARVNDGGAIKTE